MAVSNKIPTFAAGKNSLDTIGRMKFQKIFEYRAFRNTDIPEIFNSRSKGTENIHSGFQQSGFWTDVFPKTEGSAGAGNMVFLEIWVSLQQYAEIFGESCKQTVGIEISAGYMGIVEALSGFLRRMKEARRRNEDFCKICGFRCSWTDISAGNVNFDASQN